MSIVTEQITNDFDSDEIVYCVIDVTSGTITSKGTIQPSETVPVQYDKQNVNLLLVYKKYDPEYCGIILLP